VIKIGLVPDEIIIYEDKHGRSYFKIVNETTKWLPTIESYEDDEREVLIINNRKIIDSEKGDSFIEKIFKTKKPVTSVKQLPLKQKKLGWLR